MSADQQFTIALLGPLVAALTSTLAFIAALLAFFTSRQAVKNTAAVEGKVEAVHADLNGKLAALVKATGEVERAAGVVEGTRAERANPMGPVVP